MSFCQKRSQLHRTCSICCRHLQQPGKDKGCILLSSTEDAKGLRQFLGLSNYYSRFVANYSTIAEPLHKLLRKSRNFHWDPCCQKAFGTLKQKLVSPPVLAFPDFCRQFVLHTDVSDVDIGGILGLVQDSQKWVTWYWSRQLQYQSDARYKANAIYTHCTCIHRCGQTSLSLKVNAFTPESKRVRRWEWTRSSLKANTFVAMRKRVRHHEQMHLLQGSTISSILAHIFYGRPQPGRLWIHPTLWTSLGTSIFPRN